MDDKGTASSVVAAQRLAVGAGEISLFRSGEGRPTLYLHTAGGAGTWSRLHEILSAGRDLIAPDHPGFGLSDEYEALDSVSALVRHYLGLLDQLGIAQVDLVGASFGGWVAAELACHSPDRVRALILLAPIGLRIPEEPVVDLIAMSPEERIRSLYSDQQIADRILAVPPTSDRALAVARDLEAFRRYAQPPGINNPALDEHLHRISAPTRVVAAELDRIVPLSHSRRYAELIPGASLQILPALGHALHGEKPTEVADAIRAFLDD